MPDPILRALSLILAAVFAWAALAKAARWQAWRRALAGYELPESIERAASVGTPVVEAAVAALLLTGRTLVGASAALGLLSTFSLIVLRARAARGDRLPCGCFGKATTRDYKTLLVRNALLAAIAALILLTRENINPFGGVTFSRGAVVPLVLIVAGVALLAWMAAYAVPALRQKEQ